MKDIKELTIDEILEILPQCDEIIAWAKSIKEHCLSLALQGNEIKGWKIVSGKSYRKWLFEDKVKNILLKQGLKENDIYEQKMLSPSRIEKIVGKSFYLDNLEQFADKSDGNPTLVPDYDIRENKTNELSIEQLEKIFK